MKITRIIHPVGQGGFYTETLSNETQEATFVYDCGGFDKAKKKMKNYLDSFLPKGKSQKQIEAVFISHFHADHINGLQDLLEKAMVKYLFLPQLTEEVLLEAFVYNFCLTGTYNYTNRFLMNLYRGSAKFGNEERQTKIIHVNYAADNRVPEDLNGEAFFENGIELKAWDWEKGENVELSKIELFPANTLLYCCNWLFIPHNSKVAIENIKLLKKKLSDKLGAVIGITDLSVSLKKIGVEECKKIYSEVFNGQHNSYSMTLFSGTLENVWRYSGKRPHVCCDKHLFCEDSFRLCCNPNILYTGDFEPANNMNDISSFYSRLWNEIGTIQVPHHGSILNYKDELYEHPVRGIVSVGNENRYHHPDIETMVKIQNQGCHPVIVTEDKSSMRICQYSL